MHEPDSKMAGFVALSGVGLLDSATRTSALVFLPFVMESKGMGPGQISAMLFLLFGGGAIGTVRVRLAGRPHGDSDSRMG